MQECTVPVWACVCGSLAVVCEDRVARMHVHVCVHAVCVCVCLWRVEYVEGDITILHHHDQYDFKEITQCSATGDCAAV